MDFDQDTLDRSAQWGRILAICHFVLGGLVTLFTCFPGIYVVFGAAIAFGGLPPGNTSSGPPPELMGWFFMGFGLFFAVFILAMGVGLLVAGMMINRRRGWIFVMIVSCFNMLNQPMGMVLGIFTLLWLMRDDVRASFQADSEDDLAYD